MKIYKNTNANVRKLKNTNVFFSPTPIRCKVQIISGHDFDDVGEATHFIPLQTVPTLGQCAAILDISRALHKIAEAEHAYHVELTKAKRKFKGK